MTLEINSAWTKGDAKCFLYSTIGDNRSSKKKKSPDLTGLEVNIANSWAVVWRWSWCCFRRTLLSHSHQLVSGSQDCTWPRHGSRPSGSWASQAWGANWAPLIWLPVRWPELSPWVEPLARSPDTRLSLWGTPGFTQSHVFCRTLRYYMVGLKPRLPSFSSSYIN